MICFSFLFLVLVLLSRGICFFLAFWDELREHKKGHCLVGFVVLFQEKKDRFVVVQQAGNTRVVNYSCFWFDILLAFLTPLTRG